MLLALVVVTNMSLEEAVEMKEEKSMAMRQTVGCWLFGEVGLEK